MSHQILERDIQVGTEMAWHHLTKVVPVINLRENDIRYPMITTPTYIRVNGVEIPTGAKSIISTDDNLPIGNPVGGKYSLLSNEHVTDMIAESLAGIDFKVVSIGSINNRGEVFVSIEIKGASEVVAAGRKTKSMLNVMWSHNGVRPVIAKTGLIVIVCANTQAMALSEKSDFSFKVKHTLNAAEKLEDMEKAIDAHVGVVAEFKKAMDSLASLKCNDARAEKIAAGILTDGDVLATRTRNTVDRVVQLFQGGAGNKGETLADLYNGFTDFYTHESRGGESQWKQFVSSEFGAASRAKSEVYSILTDKARVKEMEVRGGKVLAATLAN